MNTKLTLLTTVALTALALSGCTTDSDRTIVAEGSSTVKPLATVWAEEVLALDNPLDVSVAGGGSTHGATAFCNGLTDIGHMSRDLRDSDREKCDKSGRELVQWKIALDALSVVMQKDNANIAIDDLSVDELRDVFAKDGASKWSDVRSEFPNETIVLCFPDDASGTFGYFEEEIMEHGDTVAEFKRGSPHQQSAEDEVLVDCLKGNEYAVGFFGFSYYDSARSTLRAIAIENDDGDFVKPEITTAVDGSYNPLSRFLYMLTEQAPKQAVKDYLEYVLDEGQDPALMEKAGFISLDPTTLNQMRAQYANLD